MKKVLLILLFVLWSQTVFAGETQYRMRVDGLACPYCAYGIEKKLVAIEGVQNFEMDLEIGIVSVRVSDGVVLQEADMKQLFTDAGFTFRSMQISYLDQEQTPTQQ